MFIFNCLGSLANTRDSCSPQIKTSHFNSPTEGLKITVRGPLVAMGLRHSQHPEACSLVPVQFLQQPFHFHVDKLERGLFLQWRKGSKQLEAFLKSLTKMQNEAWREPCSMAAAYNDHLWPHIPCICLVDFSLESLFLPILRNFTVYYFRDFKERDFYFLCGGFGQQYSGVCTFLHAYKLLSTKEQNRIDFYCLFTSTWKFKNVRKRLRKQLSSKEKA